MIGWKICNERFLPRHQIPSMFISILPHQESLIYIYVHIYKIINIYINTYPSQLVWLHPQNSAVSLQENFTRQSFRKFDFNHSNLNFIPHCHEYRWRIHTQWTCGFRNVPSNHTYTFINIYKYIIYIHTYHLRLVTDSNIFLCIPLACRITSF